MSWSKVSVPTGAKLFKVHNFTYLLKGTTYHLEIDEFQDGACTGHGEHSTDKNFYIESVSGKSVEECLKLLVEKVADRA